MYLAKVSFALLAVLGAMDNWRVRAAAPPAGPTHSPTNAVDVGEASDHEQDKRYHQQPPPPPLQYPEYHPPDSSQPYPPLAPQPIPPLYLDQFNYRYPDGSYEFRYASPDKTVRYERGFFIPYQNTRVLVVKGFYSYQLREGPYYTVFYTADQFGFRHDSSSFSWDRPQLPRSLKAEVDGDFRDYEAADTTPVEGDLD